MVKKDTMLRFWCQKVLPLVYDDSLSYYEVLNKVVLHLNQHTEDINALIDFYDTFTEDVEEIIRQMMDDGEFNEIVADTIGSMIAEEYDPEQQYTIFDYCVYNSKLYRANASTTGEFDPEKWDERNVGYDLTTIQNYIYSLNAGNVSYDDSETYSEGTVGAKILSIFNDLNLFKQTLNIQTLEELSALSRNAFVQIGNAAGITLGDTGVTLPRYSKGVLVVSSSTSCSLYVITPAGDLIYARKDTEWVSAKTLSSLDSRITTNTNNITANTASLNATEKGIAFIVDGDTANYPISSGNFAYIKNNTHGLTEGLYIANSSFPATGGTADSTAFTAVNNGGLNTLFKRFYCGEISTPAEHYHYVDINRTVDGITYNYIIATLAQNASFILCAYALDSSTFRVIARNLDGSSVSSIAKINYILCK